MHLEPQARGEDAGGGVVGEEPVAAEWARQGQGLGLSQVEKAAARPSARLLPGGGGPLCDHQPLRPVVRPGGDPPVELPRGVRRRTKSPLGVRSAALNPP